MAGLLSSIADLLLAPICLGCDGQIAPGDSARLVCRTCRARLRPVPTPACSRCGATRRFTGRSADGPCAECAEWPDSLCCARAACLLHPPADALVHQFKYRGWKALAVPLAERMAPLLPRANADSGILVPVPTLPRRLRERGYNQAELLARALARITGQTVVDALARVNRNTSQTTLQPVGRRANVAGAFRADAAVCRQLARAHVVLVDDVLTTGATASECARTLVAAGVRSVTLITFARALDARRLTRSGWSTQ
jgi:ComF family protein